LVGLWIVADAVAPVTWGAPDPAVVHPEAVSAILVASGLVPELDNGGLKVTVPDTFVQLTVPAATVPPAAVVGVAAEVGAVVEVVVVDACVVVVVVPPLELEEQPESTATSARGTANPSNLPKCRPTKKELCVVIRAP